MKQKKDLICLTAWRSKTNTKFQTGRSRNHIKSKSKSPSTPAPFLVLGWLRGRTHYPCFSTNENFANISPSSPGISRRYLLQRAKWKQLWQDYSELNYTDIFRASSLLVALITVVPIHNTSFKCVCFCCLLGPLQLLIVKQINIFFTSFPLAYVHFPVRLCRD